MDMKRLQEIESRLRVIDTERKQVRLELETADHGAYGQIRRKMERRMAKLDHEARQLKEERREIYGIPQPRPASRTVRNVHQEGRMMEMLAEARDRIHPNQSNPYREAM